MIWNFPTLEEVEILALHSHKIKYRSLVETVALGEPVDETLTSISASSLTIRSSSLTGRVTDPTSSTSAVTEHFIPRSKLVVDNDTLPSFASIRTFCKIGIVFLDPTTLDTSCRPELKWSLLILKFIRFCFEAGLNFKQYLIIKNIFKRVKHSYIIDLEELKLIYKYMYKNNL